MQAYAIKAATQWMVRRRHEVEAQAKAGSGAVGVDALLDDLPELHATGAGLKALCCVLAADGIEDLRRSCGGAPLTCGVLMVVASTTNCSQASHAIQTLAS